MINNTEINLHLAKLDGREVIKSERGTGDYYFKDSLLFVDYTTDMNLLMPLAWKYGVAIQPMYKIGSDERLTFACWSVLHEKSTPNKDPVQAIIDCLMQIEVNDE